jgi:hypothetical protein
MQASRRLAPVNRQSKGAKAMTKHFSDAHYDDTYEYHGNTIVEIRRARGGITIWREWCIFDSVEEAVEFFNSRISG